MPKVEAEIIEQNKRFFEFFLRISLPKGYDNKKTAIKFIKKISWIIKIFVFSNDFKNSIFKFG